MGRALQERLGIVHVEVDRHHLPGEPGYEGRRIERAEWIAAYQAAHREVEAALAAGLSVVFDAVSYRRTQRDRIRRIASKHGVPMTVVHLNVSADEARARLIANRASPTRVNVPEEDFNEVAGGMQPPDQNESFVNYRPDEPVDAWIARVIAPLLKEPEK
jgi:predicted kinase